MVQDQSSHYQVFLIGTETAFVLERLNTIVWPDTTTTWTNNLPLGAFLFLFKIAGPESNV